MAQDTAGAWGLLLGAEQGLDPPAPHSHVRGLPRALREGKATWGSAWDSWEGDKGVIHDQGGVQQAGSGASPVSSLKPHPCSIATGHSKRYGRSQRSPEAGVQRLQLREQEGVWQTPIRA